MTGADPEAGSRGHVNSLEIVIGSHIIFISILAGRLPQAQQNRARVLGLAVAMLSRIALLLSIRWVMRLTTPLFDIWNREISGRDMILIAGGLFLLGKATSEIHARLEGEEDRAGGGRGRVTFAGVIAQIWSRYRLLARLGDHCSRNGRSNLNHGDRRHRRRPFMMFFSRAVSNFVHRHPTVRCWRSRFC